MSIRVVTYAQYLSNVAVQWRAEDYAASKLIKAVKGENINGYAWIPAGNTTRRLDNGNASEAIGWCADRMANTLQALLGNGSITLVPIPCSNSLKGSPIKGPPWHLARALANRLGKSTGLVNLLQWTSYLGSARSGQGVRDPAVLEQHLSIDGPVPQSGGSEVVLVDDVYTSGGHIRACVRRLRAAGAKVDVALAAGRTVDGSPNDDAFAEIHENIPD